MIVNLVDHARDSLAQAERFRPRTVAERRVHKSTVAQLRAWIQNRETACR